jgi:hypothetical protein
MQKVKLVDGWKKNSYIKYDQTRSTIQTKRWVVQAGSGYEMSFSTRSQARQNVRKTREA